MPLHSKQKPVEKQNLHPRSLHRGRYNFKQLCQSYAELEAFVALNQYGDESIDFSNQQAVKALNKALLKHFYGVNNWDIPQSYLCPPIPGRADYIHYMADVLGENNNGNIPKGDKVKVLDIGMGANCVYPLIGNSIYGWQFVGADVDPVAIRSANKIISANPQLNSAIEVRLQSSLTDIFKGVVKPGEIFDITICNPPFHASIQEAVAGSMAKWENLGISKQQETLLNFGGQGTELWYPGGEAAFINRMIGQSALIPNSCLWFSTLVSKKDTLVGIYKTLNKFKVVDVKTINMSQGQKVSRIVAWTFLNEAEQLEWSSKRW